MTDRHLRITLQADWRAALRQAGERAQAPDYQGEVFNFGSPGALFSRLSENRWALVRELQSHGEIAVRKLARRVGR